MNKIYFIEIQRFRELAFFVFIWILQMLFFVLMTKQVIFHKPVGIQISDNVFIAINLLILAINLLLNSLKLKTQIEDGGISIKYTPYHLKERILLWHDIIEIRFVKYDGFKEYSGYGLRYSRKMGWCYTISGNFGIRLYLRNGKTILIGTHKSVDIQNVIRELRDKKLIPNDILIN